MRYTQYSGFTLLEVVIATAMIIVAISSLMTLAVNTQRNSRILAEKTFATVKASEGLELVRLKRDNNLLDQNPNTNWDSDLAIADNSFSFENKTFNRKITISNCPGACREINSTITWENKKFELKTQLTDWRLET